MIGENIKKLRVNAQMTQKDLAEKLFVTYQAVSRWENGEVEPSVSTISEMAKIFNVSCDYILGNEEQKPLSNEKESSAVATEAQAVLALCEKCNKPIYHSEDIVRKNRNGRSGMSSTYILCKKCAEEEEKENQKKQEQSKLNYKADSKKRRVLSYFLGGLSFLIFIGLSIYFFNKNKSNYGIGLICAAICSYTYISCLLFANNFIEDLTGGIISWGYVTMPGVIFNFDLDGLIWLITIKLVLWVIGFIIATFFAILAIIVGAIISLFVFPFALKKNIQKPELNDD